MTYKKQFGVYDVQTSEGFSKWFKAFDKAVDFFNSFSKDFAEDAESGDFVRLVNLKTGELLLETIF